MNQIIRQCNIQQYVNSRGIQSLYHFTRLENLPSILKNGLLGRVSLSENDLDYIYNDTHRLDNVFNAICISIAFPNYKMFYSMRQKSIESEWVVLELKPEILWELSCIFNHSNAASNEVKRYSLEDRQTLDGLEYMFHDEDLREQLMLPIEYTTDPQAEVLVLDRIPQEYILKVYFDDNQNIDHLNNLLKPLVAELKTEAEEVILKKVAYRNSDNKLYITKKASLFTYRKDFSHWRKEISY